MDKHYKDRDILAYMYRFAKSYKKEILFALMMMIFTTLVQLFKPAIIGRAIDNFVTTLKSGSYDFKGVIIYSAVYLGVLIAGFITLYYQSLMIGIIGQKIIFRIREEIFTHILRIRQKYFDTTPAGKIVTRITNDTEAVNEMYTNVVVSLSRDILLISGTLIAMCILNIKLALLIMLTAPILIVLIMLFRKFSRENYTKLRAHIASMNGFLSETISGMKVIDLFNIGASKRKAFSKINNDVNDTYLSEIMIFGTFRPLMFLVSQVSLCIVLYYAALLILDDRMSIGTVFIFIQYLNLIYEPILELSEQFNILQSAITASEKIIEIQNVETEDTSAGTLTTESLSGRIEFCNVSFAYTAENWVLKDFSLTIEPGDSVAIVGPTGAGKTTLINILTRFYEIQKGTILLDGKDIRTISPDELRKTIGVVMQDVFIYSGSFNDNIRLFEGTYTENDIKKAAEFVNADEFITKYPDSYTHHISERGATLSAGQRQLVSLARNVLHNPPVLILDEATAHIDPHTESLIQDALGRIMKNKTTIVIAHRLSTIQHASKIIVLVKGAIHETGDHKSLMDKKGMYFELYNKQFYG